MKNLEEYEVGFNPKKIEDPKLKKIFSNDKTKKLWCSIKAGHITSQYFNDSIISAGKELKKLKNYPTYHEFIESINGLTHKFGIVPLEDRFCDVCSVIDNEFWVSVYETIYKSRHFKLKIRTT